jgi:hypothetical protein
MNIILAQLLKIWNIEFSDDWIFWTMSEPSDH